MTLFLDLLPRMDPAEYGSSDRIKFTHTKLQAFNAKTKIKLGSKFYPNKFVHPCQFRENDTCQMNPDTYLRYGSDRILVAND